MKTLYLLRHAETSPATVGQDKSRMLTAYGEKKTQDLGAVMEQNNYRPDLILCSPATRTKQTMNRLNSAYKEFSTADELFPEELYGASCATLLDFVLSTDDSVNSLMIIAHNPGIYELVALLANEKTRDSIGFSYSPGTLSIFECDVQSWKNVEPRENRVVDILRPDSKS